MAVVAKGTKVRPCVPVGYEVVSDVRVVTENVTAGDLLILGPNGWSRSTNATPANKRGFAAQDYAAGRADCSIFTSGELDGFTGLVPGDPLYPSATAGAIDTTALAGFVGLIHAVSATRIAFTL